MGTVLTTEGRAPSPADQKLPDEAQKPTPARRLIPDLTLFLLLPACAFAAVPLVRGPIFASSDGILHLYQLVEFDRALQDGVLFPRWAPDLMAGYGQPLFVFYAPVMYYLSALFHAIGLSFADALKATVLTGLVASALGMYVFGRELWGRWGGLLSAIAFVYVPYRFVNTYLDGELSQSLAWAWLPWLSWTGWRYLQTRRTGWGAAAAACYAGLIYTHSVTAWLATIFVALALTVRLFTARARLLDELRLGGWLALGVGLAAPYWLPALVESADIQLQRVQTGSYDFHTNLLPLARTLSAQLAHDYSEYIGVNGPAQLGLAQTAIAALGLVAALAWSGRQRMGDTAAPAAGLFTLLSAIGFVLMLVPSAPFWEHVPFGHSLQFPDRLLGIMALPLAVLAGGLVAPFRRSRAAAAVATLASVLLIYGATAGLDVNYVSLPDSFGPRDVVESEQSTGAIATTAKGEYTPRWMSQPALTSPLVAGYLTGQMPALSGGSGVEVEVLEHASSDMRLRVSAQEAGAATLPVTFYPGWAASGNGGALEVQPSARGLISVRVPAGTSEVRLHFGSTPDRQLAGATGLAGLAILLYVILRSRTRRGIFPAGNSGGERAGLPASRRYLLPLLGGGAVLAIGLTLVPDRLQLRTWPASRPEQVSYKGWLQLWGSDVSTTNDRVHVTGVFVAGAAQSAFPLTATVRLLTKETVWTSAMQPMSPDGWTTMIPRRFDFDLPLAAGTPPGTYLLEMQLRRDGGIQGADWAKLTYDAPRVGPVILGPVTLSRSGAGGIAGAKPAAAEFGPLELMSWEPPPQAVAGDYVPIGLLWRVNAVPSADWTVSLHLVDAQGRTWAGHDDQPRLGYNPTSLWPAGQLERDVQMVLLPSDMPPGDYQLKVGWYDSHSQAAVGPQNVTIGNVAVQAH